MEKLQYCRAFHLLSHTLKAMTNKERGAALTIWLSLIAFFNLVVVLAYWTSINGTGSLSIYTNWSIWAVHVVGILVHFNIACVVFLFRWKKWAFFAFAGSVGIAFTLNYMVTGEMYLLGIASPAILYLLLRAKWHLLE
jgi:magnesium-transporting ATPase (P-type)